MPTPRCSPPAYAGPSASSRSARPACLALTGRCQHDNLLSIPALAAGDRLARPAELSSARWQVLGVVDHGPATVASVARTMGLTRQSVQLTANALVESGHVELVDNPDHRTARLIAITAAGRRA